MSDSRPSRPRRRTVLLIGAGVGVLLVSAGAVALVSGLAIADQPGQPLDVPALVVEVDPAAPAPVATAPVTPAPTMTSSPEPGSPELVPAPTPVVVDDHGGDRPDDVSDDNRGSGSSDD